MILSEIANNTQVGLMDNKHFAQGQLSGNKHSTRTQLFGCIKNTYVDFIQYPKEM